MRLHELVHLCKEALRVASQLCVAVEREVRFFCDSVGFGGRAIAPAKRRGEEEERGGRGSKCESQTDCNGSDAGREEYWERELALHERGYIDVRERLHVCAREAT
jgi:hypothetical protein